MANHSNEAILEVMRILFPHTRGESLAVELTNFKNDVRTFGTSKGWTLKEA